MDEKYYIIDSDSIGKCDCLIFWRENGEGYTKDIKKAGKFNKEYALEVVKSGLCNIVPCELVEKSDRQRTILPCDFDIIANIKQLTEKIKEESEAKE